MIIPGALFGVRRSCRRFRARGSGKNASAQASSIHRARHSELHPTRMDQGPQRKPDYKASDPPITMDWYYLSDAEISCLNLKTECLSRIESCPGKTRSLFPHTWDKVIRRLARSEAIDRVPQPNTWHLHPGVLSLVFLHLRRGPSRHLPGGPASRESGTRAAWATWKTGTPPLAHGSGRRKVRPGVHV